jgi:transcription antitermination factor NusG
VLILSHLTIVPVGHWLPLPRYVWQANCAYQVEGWFQLCGVSIDGRRFQNVSDCCARGSFRALMNSKAIRDRWYALQVRNRWESSTATLLCGKGYQTFLPTHKAKKCWRAGSKEVAVPLFPGYVFCQFDVHDRLPVLVTPGVIAVVGRGRIPVPVEDSEMEAIQRVVSAGFPAEPWPYLEVGQQVRIRTGALSGLEGILTSSRGTSRIVVSVSLLCRSVALEIDRSAVCPIQSAGPTLLGPLSIPQLLEAVGD